MVKLIKCPIGRAHGYTGSGIGIVPNVNGSLNK